jgi:hypothetical protein
MQSKQGIEMLAKVRRICRPLPEVEEIIDGFGRHGWVSINSPQDWEVLGDLLKEAYLRAAPKRLVKQLLE